MPVAVSGFKTPTDPLYACLAMIVSLALCFAVSAVAKKAGWKSGESNDFFFYTGTAEEWRAKHHIVKN